MHFSERIGTLLAVIFGSVTERIISGSFSVMVAVLCALAGTATSISVQHYLKNRRYTRRAEYRLAERLAGAAGSAIGYKKGGGRE